MDEHLPRVGQILRAAVQPGLIAGAPEYIAWLAPEGIATDDGRMMDPGALRWRDGALPLMASDQNLPAHLAAQLVANLVDFERRFSEDGVAWVVARALFDSDEVAQEFRRMVECEADEDGCVQMRGVSIDLAIQDATVREDPVPDEDPAPEEPEEEDDWPEGVWLRVHDGIIVGATLVPMPAFADARVEPALAAAGFPDDQGWTFPVAPPAAWFQMPRHDGLVPWTVTDQGRVFGHFAPRDSCHTGLRTCTNMPEDADFSKFLTGEIVTAEGTRIPVGQVVLAGGHPEDYDEHNRFRTFEAVTRAYADPDRAGADIFVGIDEWGSWAAGAARPGITPEMLRVMRASPLSGHWRYEDRPGIGPNFLIGLPCVNNQGFPVPRLGLAASAFIHEGELAEVFTQGPTPLVSPSATIGEIFRGLAASATGDTPARIDFPGAVTVFQPPLSEEGLEAAIWALVQKLSEALELGVGEYERFRATRRGNAALSGMQEPSVTVG